MSRITRRAALGAVPAAGIAMMATPSSALPDDAELMRLLGELERIVPVCHKRELALSRACDAWSTDNPALSFDTPEGQASYLAAIDPFQDASDEVWEERDAIAALIRDTPARSFVGLLAKARALRFELYVDLGKDQEESWALECVNGFVREIERLAGEAGR